MSAASAGAGAGHGAGGNGAKVLMDETAVVLVDWWVDRPWPSSGVRPFAPKSSNPPLVLSTSPAATHHGRICPHA